MVLKNFQSFIEQSIFVVQKSLLYEKAFNFDEKYDAIKFKWFSYMLSDLLNKYKKSKIGFFEIEKITYLNCLTLMQIA